MTQTNPEIRAAFELFDSNNDGKIDFDEFARMLRTLGQALSDDQARESFPTIDADGDGSVNLDEFVRWWQRNVDVVDIDYNEDD